METIKRGSRGESVKTLQKALSLYPDGIFGHVTEQAVIAYQKAHGLIADGIVGAKTWAALGYGSQAVDPAVVYMPLNVHVTKANNRPIKYLAIHYTAGGSSAAGGAKGVKRVFEVRRASADFAVDDCDMVQFNPNPRDYFCWAVGDKKAAGVKCIDGMNRNTISIEICSTLRKGASAAYPNHDGWSISDKAVDNAVRLAKILMAKYGIPIENVVRHYDITGKLCPGVVGWNNGRIYTDGGVPTGKMNNSNKWEEFKRRLL